MLKIIIIVLIFSFSSPALSSTDLEKLEDDVIEYCKEIEDNRDRFYMNDVAECVHYIQQTHRLKAYIKFLGFNKRYQELIKEEKDRIERLERLLNYWVEEEEEE